MGFSKAFLSIFIALQILLVVSVEGHWHHDHVVVVEPSSPYYHPDHVVVVEGRHHARIYDDHPYYYYAPQYYYEPTPVVVAPASAVNVDVHL